MERPFIEVDGEMVPTSHHFWEQMMAMSCRIDRLSLVAWIALTVASLELSVLVAFIVLVLR